MMLSSTSATSAATSFVASSLVVRSASLFRTYGKDYWVTPRHGHIPVFRARISDSLPPYRVALIRTTPSSSSSSSPSSSSSSSSPGTSTCSTETSAASTATTTVEERTPPVNSTSLIPDTCSSSVLSTSTHNTPSVLLQQSHTTSVSPPHSPQYTARRALASELYTAADIRCEAFYNSPKDANYHPVRRREIYMAMRSRVELGTWCIVLIDNAPPKNWQALGNSNGDLVVATLDVTLHCGRTGKRKTFESLYKEQGNDGEEKPSYSAYISSMAVRKYWRGRGLAQQLLAYTCELIRNKGVISDLYLHVEWENQAAVRIYSKHGFRDVGRPKNHWLHNLAKPEHTLMHLPLALFDVRHAHAFQNESGGGATCVTDEMMLTSSSSSSSPSSSSSSSSSMMEGS